MASLVGAVKPYVNNWAAPVAVSPLIRAARWGALLYGIYYGVSRHNALAEPAKKEYDAYLAQKVGGFESQKIRNGAVHVLETVVIFIHFRFIYCRFSPLICYDDIAETKL